ncbi:MAG: MBL fold metallo-hydrolase [Deltaproteobacteria bacterium]|nr:MBL fold metallo-hydrolase [Deltaproteobacteria bacterium]
MIQRIHHLNCVSACPLGGALMDGRSRSLRGRLVCHCILVETEAGLVLLDTGYGLMDVADPVERLSWFFLALLDPDFREELTAVRQIEALGFSARDVRHIVLTHLDFDHAGGLDDFPEAIVHLLTTERETAEAQRTWLDRQRYRPQQWSSRSRWRTYDADAGGGDWFGFAAVRELEGVPPEVLLVPLIGHTFGHAGIAVQHGPRWILMAGDAYFDHREMNLDHPRCRVGLRFYQWMMEQDRAARLVNQQRLRELIDEHGREIHVISSHDPYEFEALTGHPMAQPLEPARFPQHVYAEYPSLVPK